jgi:hypothetical protein
LTRLKHETLVRLTQPRRSAELRRDLTRARDDAALKQAALDQEKSDYARLEKLLRDDALEPDERRALALLAELWGGGASEAASQGRGGGQLAKRFEDASALWKGAGRARTARRDQALRSRLLRASGPGSAGAGSK